MSFSLEQSQKIIEIIQSAAPYSGSNLNNVDDQLAKALGFFLNSGLGTSQVNISGDYELPSSFEYGNQILRLSNRTGSQFTITPNGSDTIEGESSIVIYDGETMDFKLDNSATNWTI